MNRINFSKGYKLSPQFKPPQDPKFIDIFTFAFQKDDKTIEQLYFGIDENELNVEEQKLYQNLLKKLLENKTNKSFLQISNEINQTDGMFQRHYFVQCHIRKQLIIIIKQMIFILKN